MNLIGNKKAHDLGGQGLIDVNTGILTMTIVAEKIDLQHTLTGDQVLDLVEVDIGGNKQFAVDARSLHLFLESKRKFSDWIKSRLIKYGFIENEDFILASQNCEAKHGGHNKSDYYLTLDVAKELSMVENNEKGREARRYFIRCEKLAFEAMKEKFMGSVIETRKVISPEQKDSLQKIVDAKVNGNHGLRAQVWTRHNRHFKINSYHELLAIHFEDSVQYLLSMEVKGKVENPLVPMQVNNEPWNDTDVQFLMWFVPKISKIIKNDIYPALSILRSECAAQVIGITQEMAVHANALNRRALKHGMTHYSQLGGQPIHTIEWYLS
ncbi:antA/AntB antirepressor family protein [Acinetobacter baumannii]|uniref:antA/AntB antirepressor family protein n=1 Tax=Acinetobacter baumannii TaxID=470 RepID=UPI00070BDDFE|nr:antA/AntB antirepressor family protein [Acinetobacter baumannii]EHU1527925.1 antA/AntB antirepressor family protein [Acinetobacter baumannii]EHU1539782.1 antA/AntB antirepressor family protein [Acinetobacter baumannii]EHU2002738.1 antA/AntB antirepressor family protein [Acinetobacter baumannii]KRI30489.1 anti-repressor protein [Acinetobacter baumannii]MDC4995277.1 antA/AntB antirepressor family protein [Acinetobacter baumannii]